MITNLALFYGITEIKIRKKFIKILLYKTFEMSKMWQKLRNDQKTILTLFCFQVCLEIPTKRTWIILIRITKEMQISMDLNLLRYCKEGGINWNEC
jgi:hypothetical protein